MPRVRRTHDVSGLASALRALRKPIPIFAPCALWSAVCRQATWRSGSNQGSAWQPIEAGYRQKSGPAKNPTKFQFKSNFDFLFEAPLFEAPPLPGLLPPFTSKIAPPGVAWLLSAGLAAVFATIGAAANAAGVIISDASAAATNVFINLASFSSTTWPSKAREGTASRLVPDHACAKTRSHTEMPANFRLGHTADAVFRRDTGRGFEDLVSQWFSKSHGVSAWRSVTFAELPQSFGCRAQKTLFLQARTWKTFPRLAHSFESRSRHR